MPYGSTPMHDRLPSPEGECPKSAPRRNGAFQQWVLPLLASFSHTYVLHADLLFCRLHISPLCFSACAAHPVSVCLQLPNYMRFVGNLTNRNLTHLVATQRCGNLIVWFHQRYSVCSTGKWRKGLLTISRSNVPIQGIHLQRSRGLAVSSLEYLSSHL